MHANEHNSPQSAQSLRPAVFVHLAYGQDARRYREMYIGGLVPDLSPYGFHHAEEMGCDLTFSRDHRESGVVRFFRRAFGRVVGFDLLHALRNRKDMLAADIVWTMDERQFLAVAAVEFLVSSSSNPKLIGQSVWLFNRWKTFPTWKRRLLRKLIKRADVLTVHSLSYLEEAKKITSDVPVRLLRFGVSLDSFPFDDSIRPAHRPIRILSMGNDTTRDWNTLLKAFGNDDRFEVVLINRTISPKTRQSYRNLQAPLNPSMDRFREFYRWADYVVIPMVRNLFSGITVALEATCMGVPVVSSNTGGVPTYFDHNEVLYVEPEDPERLREAILGDDGEARAERVRQAQAKFLERDYSTHGMAARYVEISGRVLGCSDIGIQSVPGNSATRP